MPLPAPSGIHAYVVARIVRLGADAGLTEPRRDGPGELVPPEDCRATSVPGSSSSAA